jgi:hypothetical protein
MWQGWRCEAQGTGLRAQGTGHGATGERLKEGWREREIGGDGENKDPLLGGARGGF